MGWYENLTKQQKKDFWKVIAVCVIGSFLILSIPMAFHFA